ncbi:hypothetical protein ZIOFF_003033 [Zingiber officinale]|uniref:Reverse transcriptase RNase H-like domain-containing protein n=1 Tax=Zingiber officinale TaxID=94328 RepID=A0A8J5M9U0_ZINOF|nr:hypothetical protein ZIOFF_003033 [Zingiber officinale]
MEGWGGICKWKAQKYDPKSEERICAYASGKFNPIKSTIDAEIHAVMNSLNNFKIYYLDKPELVVRTDCHTIISFFNKSAQNKPSRVRWISFTDFITGLGVPVQFQYIDGKDNILDDFLSCLVCFLTACPIEEIEVGLLAQMEEAINQIKSKPNLVAVRYLANIANFMTNIPSLLVPPQQEESSTQKSITRQKGFSKSNTKPVENYWSHSGNWSKSFSSKNISFEETNKALDPTTNGAKDCQLSKNSERIFSRYTCSSKS